MKKRIFLVSCICLFFVSIPLFAASYDNNEYQRKSREYSALATKSFDEGDYDAALDYAKKAEDYAIQSEAYIKLMLLRADAQKTLYKAHTRLTWAKEQQAEKFFADAYTTASDAIASGDALFADENYNEAKAQAENALAALSVIRKIVPLPATYQVELWASSRDCLWNIAANPAIYGNPLLWSRLYEANKKDLKRPEDPNLLMPGMIIKIPSIKGEYREGMYSPSVTYEPFAEQVK